MALPEAANQRWSMDVAPDALSNGRRFRVLAVVERYSMPSRGGAPGEHSPRARHIVTGLDEGYGPG